MPAGPVRTILDVDTGTDDAVALALALRSPAIDLVAVTTVAGNVALSFTTENTRRVLAFLGAEAVAVHRGFSRPLARPLFEARHVHGERGLGGLDLPAPTDGPALRKPSAPEALIDRVMAAPGEIALICVGPLTNLAAAIALEPALPGALRRLVIMGGALDRGNVTPYAEFNIYVDPEAAAQVFATCRLTMVGLDATRRATLTRGAWRRLAASAGPEGRLVHGVNAARFGEPDCDEVTLHDPLAVAVAIDPSLCATKRGTLAVETATAWSAGQVSLAESPDGPHEACVAVDAPRFLDLLARTLGLPALHP